MSAPVCRPNARSVPSLLEKVRCVGPVSVAEVRQEVSEQFDAMRQELEELTEQLAEQVDEEDEEDEND